MDVITEEADIELTFTFQIHQSFSSKHSTKTREAASLLNNGFSSFNSGDGVTDLAHSTCKW